MHRSMHNLYNDHQEALKKGKGKQKTTLFQIELNQSIKSIMDIEVLPINSLVQVNKLHINKVFSL